MESSVQKTRKVLEYLLHKFYDGEDGYPHARLNIRDKGMIKAALSIPLRNCDVGTAQEQDDRMALYCKTRKCESCPLWDSVNNGVRCEFTWAQMPYEAR